MLGNFYPSGPTKLLAVTTITRNRDLNMGTSLTRKGIDKALLYNICYIFQRIGITGTKVPHPYEVFNTAQQYLVVQLDGSQNNKNLYPIRRWIAQPRPEP